MDARDDIPLEDAFAFQGAGTGPANARFYAFNTVIVLQAYAPDDVARRAFEAARDRCRFFERAFSRTLPHSDVSRVNAASGAWTRVCPETFELLRASLRYCEHSGGVFDVTMGSAVRLWDFHAGIVPDAGRLAEALAHVDWRAVELKRADGACYARLSDPLASLDVGGTAKGFIADELGALLQAHGVDSFLVDLGGNVLARGRKPDGGAWNIGLQDPSTSRADGSRKVLGTVALTDASAVTSGIYERAFERDGVRYHHILDPETGFPARTDLAGATIIARSSLDAEGYSTTVLALGSERAVPFVRAHPAIVLAVLVFPDGRLETVSPQR